MTGQLPTGVVTLLFTDIEGSTRLLREVGDAYAEALAEHRRIVREAVVAHGGAEVDTQGDAFFVAFARASDAVAAAVDAQRALAGGPVRVRMGLHTGEPRLTDEGYVGVDVHRAARIAAVGHGGQVLLSQATRALVEVDARDLGPHRLKDLSAPERIFQLEMDGLPSDFPPLRTLEAGSSNLPAARTSFVGRVKELASIDRLLDDAACRLLTLVGPGGVGKTRLALEAASRRLDRYQHGVHFAPLASVASPDLLPAAVAASLGFEVDSQFSGFAAREQLLDFLRPRSTLLVLDNFEHLVEGSQLLAEVVEQAPGVAMLATSRERLDIQSEWVFDVDGLTVSGNGSRPGRGEAPAGRPVGDIDGRDGVTGGSAVRLFVERARQADASFALTEEVRPQVARICGLVEGMPLGIELAAAWTSVLPCAEIADEIERGLDFLSTSARDVPERHRSLRAACDHSWRLLTDEQRDVFARLSVVRGGFTREAAAAVAGADLRALSDLVGKSLVRRLELGRFDIHEFLRQYAAGQLAEDPGRQRRAFEDHASYYLGRLRSRRTDLLGPRVAEARDELRGELPDLRAAAEWAAVHWDDDAAREAFAALSVFFFVHGEYEGGRTYERIVAAQEQAGTTGAKRLSALVYGARSAAWLGYDERCEQIARECLSQVREAGLTAELGSCLLALGSLAFQRDDYPAAVPFLEEAAEVFTALGDPLGLGASLAWLGFARQLLGDFAGARAAYEAGYATADESGNPLFRAYLLSKLGLQADAEGDYAAAMRLQLRAQELFTGVGDVGGTGYTFSRSSMSAFCLGDYPAALRLARAGYEAFSSVNHRWGVTSALCRTGLAAAALGDRETARRDLGRALELAQRSQAQSLALHALSGVGVLLARQGDDARAAELLIATLEHPGMPATYRMVAQPTLDAIEARLAPEALAAAREAAARADLQTLIDAARRDLAS
jgi:predicted ATPase/class 3 adenylate cyclase